MIRFILQQYHLWRFAKTARMKKVTLKNYNDRYWYHWNKCYQYGVRHKANEILIKGRK